MAYQQMLHAGATVAGQLSAGFDAGSEADAAGQEAARVAFEQDRAELIGATLGYLTSGGNAINVDQGASVARSAVANNRQLHTREADLIALYAGVAQLCLWLLTFSTVSVATAPVSLNVTGRTIHYP